MKILKKSIVLLNMLLLCLFAVSSHAFAATAAQDGIEVVLETDKDAYSEEDTIKVTLTVTNTNDYEVTGIKIKSILPEGYSLAEGSDEIKEIDSLGAGETVTETTYVKKTVNNDQPVTGDIGDTGNKPQDSGDDKHLKIEASVINTNNPISTAAAVSTNAPKTDDMNGLGICVLLLFGAGMCAAQIIARRKRIGKRIISLFLCAVMVGSILGTSETVCAVGNSSTLTQTFSLSKTVTVGNEEIKIESVIEYVIHEYGNSYTRGEWIGILADMLDMNLDVDVESIEYYFADTEGTEYAVAIETAQAYGILPDADVEDLEQDVPMFYTDAIATREFAAYTAIKAMGFESTYTIAADTWDDWDDIAYKQEAAIAVNFNFLDLKNNRFCPASALSTIDVQSIEAAIKEINASADLTGEEAYDNSIYADDTVSLDNVEDYRVTDNNDGTFSVEIQTNGRRAAYNAGDVVIIQPNEKNADGVAIKISSVAYRNNHMVLTGTAPEVEDVFEKIDFSGVASADIDNIIASEGVTCAYLPSASTFRAIGGSTSVPGKLEFEFADKKFGDDLKATGKVTVEVPDVTCKLDADLGLLSGVTVNEFIFSVEEKIKMEGQIKYTLAESGYELTNSLGNTRFEGGRIELGRMPFYIGSTGFSIDLILFCNVSASGTASITYTIDAVEGYQYRNGSGRAIFSFDRNLEDIQLNGSVKAGIGVAADVCAYNLMDLAGYSGEVGVGFNVSYTSHETGEDDILYCGDAILYAYAKHGLDQETVVGKFLHYTLEFEPLKNDDSNPWRVKYHLENGIKVPECTFGLGSISGKVQDNDTGELLYNARIEIFRGTDLVRRIYTDANGQYTISNLPADDYKVVISATGYMKYEMDITVERIYTTYLDAAMMVDRSTLGEGMAQCTIIDAVTGLEIEGANYELRKGWNNSSEEVCASGSIDSGSVLSMEAGNYTLTVSKEGYVTGRVNIAVNGDLTTNVNVVLNPEYAGDISGDENIRIVLTWGELPWDLDSHLFGPGINDSGETFHTYYADKEYYDTYNEEYTMIAGLDLDDVTSYGPETTTIYYRAAEGTYSFYVHDFTNLSSESSYALSESGAKVQVYVGNECKYTFNVPFNVEGTVWHVFDINAESGTIIPVNTFSYSSDPSTLMSLARGNEADALAVISNLPPKTVVPANNVEDNDIDIMTENDMKDFDEEDESVFLTTESDETEALEAE